MLSALAYLLYTDERARWRIMALAGLVIIVVGWLAEEKLALEKAVDLALFSGAVTLVLATSAYVARVSISKARSSHFSPRKLSLPFGLIASGLLIVLFVGRLELHLFTVQLAAKLRAPASERQLQVSLATVSTQIQTARTTSTKLHAANTTALSGAIAEVVTRNPDVPEAWQAAARLVTYRSGLTVTLPEHLPDCLNIHLSPDQDVVPDSAGRHIVPGFAVTPKEMPWMSHVLLSNCALDLDANENFNNTAVGKAFIAVKAHHPNLVVLSLVLDHVRITYSGGQMLPVTEIQFKDCFFDFETPTAIPSIPARSLTLQLLTANLQSGSVSLPSNGA